MKDIEFKKKSTQPSKLNKPIRKPKLYSLSKISSLETEYPVNDILLTCMRIQKLLEQSSRTISRFSKEIKALNREMDTVLRPMVEEPRVEIDGNGSEFYFLDHRKIFGQLLDYSDVSEVGEPDECNTSLISYKGVSKRRIRSKRKAIKNNEQKSQKDSNWVFDKEHRDFDF